MYINAGSGQVIGNIVILGGPLLKHSTVCKTAISLPRLQVRLTLTPARFSPYWHNIIQGYNCLINLIYIDVCQGWCTLLNTVCLYTCARIIQVWKNTRANPIHRCILQWRIQLVIVGGILCELLYDLVRLPCPTHVTILIALAIALVQGS